LRQQRPSGVVLHRLGQMAQAIDGFFKQFAHTRSAYQIGAKIARTGRVGKRLLCDGYLVASLSHGIGVPDFLA
jgi:hypothetical protein